MSWFWKQEIFYFLVLCNFNCKLPWSIFIIWYGSYFMSEEQRSPWRGLLAPVMRGILELTGLTELSWLILDLNPFSRVSSTLEGNVFMLSTSFDSAYGSLWSSLFPHGSLCRDRSCFLSGTSCFRSWASSFWWFSPGSSGHELLMLSLTNSNLYLWINISTLY